MKLTGNLLAKELELDAEGKIDLKQFDLKNLQQKYNPKLYEITFSNDDIERITIEDKKNSDNYITINKYADRIDITYCKSNKTSKHFSINNNGELEVYGVSDGKKYVVQTFEKNQVTSEKSYLNGLPKSEKYYKDGEIISEIAFDDTEGNYKLEYENGKPVKKTFLTGNKRGHYYIYENGVPVKEMSHDDQLIKDFKKTEKINKLVDDLRNDIYAKNRLGLPTASPSIADHIAQIEPDEIESIILKYQAKYGENLLDAIDNMITIESGERNKLLDHLESLYVKNATNQVWVGKYLADKLTVYGDKFAGDSKRFEHYIKLITPENVHNILANYKKKTTFSNPVIPEKLYNFVGLKKLKDYDFYRKYIQQCSSVTEDIEANFAFNADKKKELIEHVLTQLEIAENSGLSRQYTKDIRDDIRKNMDNGKHIMTESLRLHSRVTNFINKPTTKANGKFDSDFKQGGTGDCWLLAGLISIIKKPEGKKALESLIKADNSGNVTVNLKGAGKVYKITAEEIEKLGHLSKGDGDIRAIEIAMDKYIKETGIFS